jgi:signal peptide peptidase SppA
MRYAQLAMRLFRTPLLIEGNKLNAILSAVGPRFGIEAETPEPEAYGPGDATQRKPYYVTEDKIGVIEIIGPLVTRNSGIFPSGGPTTYKQIQSEFTSAITDPEIKGVILQIDSPGGESVGCFELSDLIYSARGTKPVYAAVDGHAFSAAFALASAADRLYVTKSGGVGSVGVWLMHVDQSALNAKVGVKPTFIFCGDRKIDGNPHEPLSNEAHERFQGLVEGVYEMFLKTVARNRNMKVAAVRQTQAAIFDAEPKPGEISAVEIGFADAVGTFSDALKDLRAAIGSRKSLSVAASAASPNPQKKGASMPTEEAKADAGQQAPATEGAGTETTLAVSVVDAEAVRAETLNYAADVAELCALAGLGRKAAEYIRSAKPVAEVRKDLSDLRAAADDESVIHSHVLSETGAQAKTKTEDSPIVKAAERLAQAGKEKK